MAPAKYDLNMYRGDSYGWRFKLWQDKNRTVPTDLTGCTVNSEIRDKPSGAKIVVLNCTVTLPNIIDVVMTPDMYAICPTKGGWDLQITYPTGEVKTPIGGGVNVSPDYTDSGLVVQRRYTDSGMVIT